MCQTIVCSTPVSRDLSVIVEWCISAYRALSHTLQHRNLYSVEPGFTLCLTAVGISSIFLANKRNLIQALLQRQPFRMKRRYLRSHPINPNCPMVHKREFRESIPLRKYFDWIPEGKLILKKVLSYLPSLAT